MYLRNTDRVPVVRSVQNHLKVWTECALSTFANFVLAIGGHDRLYPRLPATNGSQALQFFRGPFIFTHIRIVDPIHRILGLGA